MAQKIRTDGGILRVVGSPGQKIPYVDFCRDIYHWETDLSQVFLRREKRTS